jgi:hypothetical protein
MKKSDRIKRERWRDADYWRTVHQQASIVLMDVAKILYLCADSMAMTAKHGNVGEVQSNYRTLFGVEMSGLRESIELLSTLVYAAVRPRSRK